MSKVAIQGNASGTGTLTVAAPNTNSDYTLTLPAQTGTIVSTDASGNVGIGTSSPTQKLEVNGSALISSTNKLNFYNTGYSIKADNGFEFESADFIKFKTGGNTERMRIDSSGNLLFNSGYGSVATAYGCRAWVNFNGTGTVAIRASGNVSSITDNGTGLFTVNFATAMPDANWAITMSAQEDVGGGPRICSGRSTQTSSAAAIEVRNSAFNTIDPAYFWVAVFR